MGVEKSLSVTHGTPPLSEGNLRPRLSSRVEGAYDGEF